MDIIENNIHFYLGLMIRTMIMVDNIWNIIKRFMNDNVPCGSYVISAKEIE